jgi:hypothetical protein
MPKQSGYVNVPRTYKTPGSHKVELAYITKKEAKKLKELDLHNSGIGKKMHYGPKGIPNYNGGGGGFSGGFDGGDGDRGGWDWGMGPEGSEGTRTGSSRSGEDRDFGDDVSLQQNTAFMATAPVPNVTNYLEDILPPREAFKTSTYAGPPSVTPRQDFNPSASVPGGPETQPFSSSDWMAKEVESTGKSVPTGGTTYLSPDQLTMNILNSASKNLGSEGFAIMVAGLKMGLDKNQIANIISTNDPTIGGGYNKQLDRTKINTTIGNYLENPFHELAGHRLLNRIQHPEFKSFLNQQLPDVQALYETGGSKLSPGYGSQGEMVTSRAGTMRDLLNLNAPIHAKSDPYLGGMDWENFSDYMKNQKEADWNLYDPNRNLTDMEQLGYTETHTAPYFDDNWDVGSEPTKAVKVGAQSNPGAYFAGKKAMAQNWGDLAKNYENYVRLNQELPTEKWGGASAPLGTIFTPEGDEDEAATTAYNLNKAMNPFGPVGEETSMSIRSRTPGLTGWPMTHNHFLVDRLVGRHLKNLPNEVQRTIKNEFNATLANPNSMINKLSRYGLADKFWEKVENFIATESEHWSPSEAGAEIQRLLQGGG